MEGRLKRRNEAVFSNLSGVFWAGRKYTKCSIEDI